MSEIKTYNHNKPFSLESGESLLRIDIAYSTLGKLNAARNNVVWICHALTANSDAESWWQGLVGKGCVIDPEKYFIVCSNVLGSCYGTTGPGSTNPVTAEPYGLDFPQFTVRDVVDVQLLLAAHLNINSIALLMGGSFGGSQALELALSKKWQIEHLLLIAVGAKETAWGIAIHETQRMALTADETFKDNKKDAGASGLKAARGIGLLTYRTFESYNTQQTDHDERTDNFKAASYIQHQGEKLVKRFHAHCYWYLLKCLDTHHVGRGRHGLENALSQIDIPTTIITVKGDMLIPASEQKVLARHIRDSVYYKIPSSYGHDGFLIETEAIGDIIQKELIKNKQKMIKEITVTDLKNLIDNDEDFQLIDVREEFEREIATIGGELIPLGQIADQISRISSERIVVVYCRSGRRSADAIENLQQLNGFDNLYNLKGGILAWADVIDPSMEKY